MKRSCLVTLAILMIFTVLPMSVFAVSVSDSLTEANFTVIGNDQSTLAPGVTMNELVLHNSSNQRVEMYVTTVDTTLDTIMVKANYKDNQNAIFGMQTLSDQVAAMEANYSEPFKVVAGINASYYNITTGQPTGAFVMEGIDASAGGDNYAFFAVLKDGTYMIGAKGEYSTYKDQIQEAVGGWIHLVKDGEVVSGLDKTTLYPRQTLGLTADGKLILMTADGSQDPITVGITIQEQAEVMHALGCVEAIHLDGGNSTTFGAVREGDDEFTLINSPSGGGERTVSNTLAIISTAVADGTFDHAVIKGDYDYFLPYSSYTFSAIGADATSGPADIPETAVWALSDTSFGTIEDGVFVSNGTLGDVEIQLVDSGVVVGSKTIHVVDPTAIAFELSKTSVPYGRTARLEFSVTYGYNEVYFVDSDFECSVEPAAAGTMSGLNFTAAAESNISSATVTAKYKYSDKIGAVTIDIEFGKGSDILFDFEDGDISNWHAKETIDDWFAEKNEDRSSALSNPVTEGSNPAHNDSYVFLASEENGGQVKSGKYSLGVRLDHVQADGLGAWIYDYLFYTGEEKVLRDVANGVEGIRLGMWIYNPGITNVCVQLAPYISNGGDMNAQYASIQGQTAVAKWSTNYEVPESGWMYVYIDLTNKADSVVQTFGAKYSADSTYHSRYPSIGRFITGGAIDDPLDLVLYIDDITLDYSDATDDRDAPVISNALVSTDGANDVALEGQKVYTNTLSFNATVAEVSANNMTGLDYDSAKIYIDGVDMSGNAGFKAANGILSLNNVSLSDGDHSITFSICDRQGNETRLTKTLTIEGAAASAEVYLAGHNDGNNTPMSGSVYYIDVKAADASQVSSINTTLKLNTAHQFEYDHIVCAKGVTVEASYDALSHELTLTIMHDGSLSGDAVLVSVPVRVWAWELNDDDGTPPNLDIVCKSVYGKVTYTNAVYNGYAGGFYTALNVATEHIGSNNAWSALHIHTEAAIADKESTCTETGYTGRTYCEGCESVVDWGTTVAKSGHAYDVVENTIACSCGHTITTNGLYSLNGVNYYILNGQLTSGWIDVDEAWYYFDTNTFAGADGEQYADNGVKFTFDNGRVISGVWVRNATGLRYWYGPGYYKDTSLDSASCRPFEIDGNTYLFSRNGYMQTGIVYWMYRLLGATGDVLYYDCGDNGIAVLLTGLYNDSFYLDGVKQLAYQLVEYEGNFYFINDGHKIAKNTKLYLSEKFVAGKTFADGTAISAGTYEFDEDGKMVIDVEIKHGIIDDCLYINGVLQKAYQLVEFEGDYYFINDGNHKIAKNTKLYLSEKFVAGKTFADGTAISAGTYEFDEDGKMVIKHGIFNDCIYINGVLQRAYQLVEFEGDYYFVNYGNHKIAKNTKLYLSEKFVAGKTFADGTAISAGTYEFDEDGKMVIKHGIFNDCIYINGVLQRAYQLVEFEGDYYFVNYGNHKIAKNTKLYLSEKFVAGKTFADGTAISAGTYEFDEDGKMVIKHGIVGNCIYINGVLQKAYQLVEFEGDYYFINNGKHEIARSTALYLSEKFVNGKTYGDGSAIAPGYYKFDADGKMIVG